MLRVREKLIIPFFDNLLTHRNVLSTLFFLNRLDGNLISLDIFLFCDENIEDLNELELLLPVINGMGETLSCSPIQQYDY